MEVGHDEKPDGGDDNTPETGAVVRGDAAEHRVGDLTIIENDGAAGDKDEEAENEPSDRKIPIHVVIITKLG